MNTLSNVEPQGGGAEPLSTGFASDVLPEVHSPSAADSHTGVSTNYAPKVAPRWKVPCWFVLRVTYGRIDKAVEDLKAKNIPTYVPMQNLSICNKSINNQLYSIDIIIYK